MEGSVRPALSAYALTRRSSNCTSTLSNSMPTLHTKHPDCPCKHRWNETKVLPLHVDHTQRACRGVRCDEDSHLIVVLRSSAAAYALHCIALHPESVISS